MHDRYIEDISCDGVGRPLFVYHSRYESIESNLLYKDAAELDSFVTKLAQRAGKHISVADPMLDATMQDGSRIQMTLGSEVTAHGSTFTIRKFKEEPITPTDLIEWEPSHPSRLRFSGLRLRTGSHASLPANSIWQDHLAQCYLTVHPASCKDCHIRIHGTETAPCQLDPECDP
jgi:flagellar protein FlaI